EVQCTRLTSSGLRVFRCYLFSFSCRRCLHGDLSASLRDLHSFPTRRSSDLQYAFPFFGGSVYCQRVQYIIRHLFVTERMLSDSTSLFKKGLEGGLRIQSISVLLQAVYDLLSGRLNR